MSDTDCPIQVYLAGEPIDCTFPCGHEPPHSWAIPATECSACAAEPPHECEFPVLPPHSILDPGPCECGKTYLGHIAEQYAAKAGMVVVDPADLRTLLLLAQDYATRDPLRLKPADSAREALDRLAALAGDSR